MAQVRRRLVGARGVAAELAEKRACLASLVEVCFIIEGAPPLIDTQAWVVAMEVSPSFLKTEPEVGSATLPTAYATAGESS